MLAVQQSTEQIFHQNIMCKSVFFLCVCLFGMHMCVCLLPCVSRGYLFASIHAQVTVAILLNSFVGAINEAAAEEDAALMAGKKTKEMLRYLREPASTPH